jgi:mono/diheme cytochrome c family protein
MPHWRGSLDAAVSTTNGNITELDALLTFLETIQRAPPGPFTGISNEALASAGASLFASHCAACHGPRGRGLPASSATLGIAPPDLTTIASRNGGTVDIRKLSESIARRGHKGGGAMPAWDQVLRKAGWPAPLVTKNLEAIARYVESIQQR